MSRRSWESRRVKLLKSVQAAKHRPALGCFADGAEPLQRSVTQPRGDAPARKPALPHHDGMTMRSAAAAGLSRPVKTMASRFHGLDPVAEGARGRDHVDFVPRGVIDERATDR